MNLKVPVHPSGRESITVLPPRIGRVQLQRWATFIISSSSASISNLSPLLLCCSARQGWEGRKQRQIRNRSAGNIRVLLQRHLEAAKWCGAPTVQRFVGRDPVLKGQSHQHLWRLHCATVVRVSHCFCARWSSRCSVAEIDTVKKSPTTTMAGWAFHNSKKRHCCKTALETTQEDKWEILEAAGRIAND